MHARDIMTTSVHVWQNAPVESAVELLAEKSVTALPVVDADGGLVGMVSAGDLLWHRVSANPPAHLWRHLKGARERRPATVRQVMSARAVTTTPEADMAEIADMMLRYNVRSVPVVDGRGIVGIVSRHDILRAAMGGDEVVTKDVPLTGRGNSARLRSGDSRGPWPGTRHRRGRRRSAPFRFLPFYRLRWRPRPPARNGCDGRDQWHWGRALPGAQMESRGYRGPRRRRRHGPRTNLDGADPHHRAR